MNVHRGSCRPGFRTAQCAVAVMWLAGAADAAVAVEPLLPIPPSADLGTSAPQTIQTETLVDIQTSPTRSPLDKAAPQAGGVPVYGLHSVSHRWWIPRGRAELGMGVGTLAYDLGPMSGRALVNGFAGQQVPTVSLGVRYHLSADARVYADATRAGSADALGHRYGSNVGIEFKSAAPSGLGFDNLRGKASLRMQLSSGYQMSLRLRRHGFRIVLRSQF